MYNEIILFVSLLHIIYCIGDILNGISAFVSQVAIPFIISDPVIKYIIQWFEYWLVNNFPLENSSFIWTMINYQPWMDHSFLRLFVWSNDSCCHITTVEFELPNSDWNAPQSLEDDNFLLISRTALDVFSLKSASFPGLSINSHSSYIPKGMISFNIHQFYLK